MHGSSILRNHGEYHLELIIRARANIPSLHSRDEAPDADFDTAPSNRQKASMHIARSDGRRIGGLGSRTETVRFRGPEAWTGSVTSQRAPLWLRAARLDKNVACRLRGPVGADDREYVISRFRGPTSATDKIVISRLAPRNGGRV